MDGSGLYEGLDWLAAALEQKQCGSLDNSNMVLDMDKARANVVKPPSDAYMYLWKGWEAMRKIFTS